MTETLLFLIDSWSSMAGGIQTVNRELCLSIARYTKEVASEGLNVVCIAKDCSSGEQEDAGRAGVNLLRADIVESLAGQDERVLKMLFHSSLVGAPNVGCVVGHSKFTGLAAHNVRAQYLPSAKLVTTYQMDVDETEGLKEAHDEVASPAEYARYLREWETRFRLELEIASHADVVFAIGPRLERSIKSSLATGTGPIPLVRQLRGGIDEAAQPRSSPPERPTFLFIGRADHPSVKGLDLFVRAAGKLVKWWDRERQAVSRHEPIFIIRGLPSDETKQKSVMIALEAQAEGAAGRRVVLVPRAFSTDKHDLVVDICRASVVVMPSRAEGFGLVALEAISYGVPVVVARDSGVAEVLEEYCVSPASEARYIVDTRGADESVAQALTNALAFFLQVPERGKLLGEHLRSRLREVCSWATAAQSFLEVVVGPRPTPSPPISVNACDEVADLLRNEARYVDDECRRICGRSIDDVFVSRGFEEWEHLQSDLAPGMLEAATAEGAREGAKGRAEPWEEVIRSGSAVVVLGDPGAGKTLCLLREVQQRCLSALGELESGTASLDDVRLAMYFHSSELAARLATTDGAVFKCAVSLFLERHGSVSDPARHWLGETLKVGRALLVVDALDEVGNAVS